MQRKESLAECDDHSQSPIELNEDVCSVLFNSNNVRQFQFPSLWKNTYEYCTKFQNAWFVRTSVFSELGEDGE